MNEFFLTTLLYLFSRYLHIVCATLLVGGTLFYEMVVPAAIGDLPEGQQLVVFARARWFFKSIVWTSAAVILISGLISSRANWAQYTNDQINMAQVSPASRPGWWWAAHASTGVISLIIALGLTIGKVPPSQPIRWMRINLVILLLVMFLATATRQTRLESTPTPHAGEAVEQPTR